MPKKPVKVVRMPLNIEQIKSLSDDEIKSELVRFLLQHEDKFNRVLDQLEGVAFIEAYLEICRLLDLGASNNK